MKMIKINFISLFLILIGSGYSFAADLNEEIPSGETRAITSPYVRFPGWENIVIVQDDRANEEYFSLVTTEGWDADIDLNDMELVQLREFDLAPSQAIMDGNTLVVPYAVSLQYKDDGLLGSLIQGTLEVLGEITAQIQEGQIVSVSVDHYGDSQQSESIGRDIGFLEKFDGNFVTGVVSPSLTHYLSQEQNISKLTEVVRENSDIQLP